MAEKDWNVRGVMTTDVHDHDRRIGGRRSPRELTTRFFARVGGLIDPLRFDFDMISTGTKKFGGLNKRVTCQNEECDHRYEDDTANRCPVCNITRQGADTRKLRVNIEVPSQGLEDWSIWIDAQRPRLMNLRLSSIDVEITDNPEYDVAMIATELVGVVPDIHIFGKSLRTLVAKDIWMKALYEKNSDIPTKIQHPADRFKVGVIDDPDEELHPDYNKFDDNEDEYKGRWF